MSRPDAFRFAGVTRAKGPLPHGCLAPPLVRAGARAVVIDRCAQSERAVRADRRAGALRRGIAPCDDGDPVMVMGCDAASSSW